MTAVELAINEMQQELHALKRRVEYLEKLDPNYGKVVAYSDNTRGQSSWSEWGNY